MVSSQTSSHQTQSSHTSLFPTTEAIGAVESVKAASDIYAPVAGVVEEINEELKDQSSLLNKDPQGKGESRNS